MNSNYDGIIRCLQDDFKHFLDTDYLTLLDMTESDKYNKGSIYIYNKYYGFIFNHESPYSNLYISERWPEGINHYVNNNYAHFIERYTKRIEAFRNYINSGEPVTFIITRPQKDHTRLFNCIKNRYPHLEFSILNLYDAKKDDIELFKSMHLAMGLKDSDNEIITADESSIAP